MSGRWRMSDYFEFVVTPVVLSVWEDLEWFDGPTLLGFNYADARIPVGDCGRPCAAEGME